MRKNLLAKIAFITKGARIVVSKIQICVRKAVIDMKIAIAVGIAAVLTIIYALCKSSGTRGE